MIVKSPIPYYGGKSKMLEWIFRVIDNYSYETYVEPFGGGGSVILAKRAGFDVYNDINSDVVNLFRIIRDEKTFPEFERIVTLMPYSRENFLECQNFMKTEDDPVKRAAYYFVIARQSFSGKQMLDDDSEIAVGWKFSFAEKRCDISQCVSSWLNAVESLPRVAKRLRQIQVEHGEALAIIKKYANEKSLMYCDPPYPLQTRVGGKVYTHEMTDDQHREFIETILSLPGHFVVSSYENGIYRPLVDSGWSIVRKKIICNSMVQRGKKFSENNMMRTEVLYCSPNNRRSLF